MASLSEEDRLKAIGILEELRGRIAAAAGEDREFIFQLRRYILKRLEFDERGTPTQRRKLKDQKRRAQRGLCAVCATSLPERGAELDRFLAIEGYTTLNTQLVCRDCHQRLETERKPKESE